MSSLDTVSGVLASPDRVVVPGPMRLETDPAEHRGPKRAPSAGPTDSRFDVFLSHASEHKAEIRAFARRLEAAGLTVWLDEEQLAPGFDPQQAIVTGLAESQHVLIWVTDAWLSKAWTRWELEQFAKTNSPGRRVLPVLRVPWNDAVLGPYLTRQVAVGPEHDDDERLWLVVCGVQGLAPGPRDSWAGQGQKLADGAPVAATGRESAAPHVRSTAARLETAFQRHEELTSAGEDTSQLDQEILGLRRELRHGPSLHAGEHLGDRFRLIEQIGRGGFATVWKAYDRQERKPVAVKVLHGQFSKDASRRDRLFRGARKMAELRHPDVVRVIVSAGEQDGFHYYVMEYVGRGDLHSAVLGRRISTDQALVVVESIADALDAAHRHGLVHRDVKPQNILLREDGTAALTDFDLVRAKDTTGGTRTGAIGTVLYAAPEQNDDASTVDHRADIYGLGMTAVFCVHGKSLPLRAMRELDAFLASLDCADVVRAALRKAVALEVEDRFESMARFRSALAAAREESPGLDEARRKPNTNAAPPAAGPSPVVTEPPPAAPSVSRRQVILGVGAVFGVGGAAVAAWKGFVDVDKDAGPTVEVDGTADDWPQMDDGETLAGGPGGGQDGGNASSGPASDGTATTGPIERQVIVASRGGVELVRIPGGTFMMGSPEGEDGRFSDEGPQHEVTLAEFYLARTPVTNAQYRRFLEARPDAPKPNYWDNREYNQDEQPVVGVSWDEATAYCEWAGLMLPTEAQWEYACRAGTTTRYHSGDDEADLARVGWYAGNSEDRLHPVGELDPNGFGLYDMHGNVWEWCTDAWVGSYKGAEHRAGDGLRTQPVGDASRVFRGGAFISTARYARSAYRSSWRPDFRDSIVGFRPAQGIRL